MEIHHARPVLKAENTQKRTSFIAWFLPPTLTAICCVLLMPLTALACGGFFTSGTPVKQNIEHIIFTIGSGSESVYKQISYK